MRERDRKVPIVQVLLKLLGYPQLKASGRLKIQLLQHLNVRMYLQPANTSSDRLPCSVQPPFRDDTIGRQPALHSGCYTIEIRIVAPHNDAKFLEIKIRIAGFEGIECPFNEPNAALDGELPLSKF